MTSGARSEPSSPAEMFRRDRLTHVLPDFARISWPSDRVRGVWEPRISRIGSAWNEIEWRSLLSGIRRCALTSASSEDLLQRSAEWAGFGLSTIPVAMSGASPGYASTSVAPRVGEPFAYRVALGAPADASALTRAIDAGDEQTMGRLLGFPECCTAFYRETWVEEGCVDTTWAMATRGGTARKRTRRIDIDDSAPFETNILWRWIGPRAVPHLPCSFWCRPSVDLARSLMALGREIGYVEEMEWLEEVLSWPLSWTAKYGIAEIRTPVLEASTRTDATAHEFNVRWSGRRVPAGATAELGSVFQTPERPGRVHSLSSWRAPQTPALPLTEPPAWYASDNGFSTRTAMDEAHAPIVELAVASLGNAGSVIDLGCGNGALLKKICDARAGVLPFGVDLEESKLAHARVLQPAFGTNFVAGNMFERIPLDADTMYSLVILMPGRLLEVDEGSARRLREWLRGHFQQMLVYAYGEWLTRYKGLLGLAERAGLALASVHPTGTAGLARIAD